MITKEPPQVAIVVPVGPGRESVLDTLESVEIFCPEPHVVFVVDDRTSDGTYEALVAAKKPHWHLFRNDRSHGIQRLVHSLCLAYEQVILRTECQLVLRLDQDALIINRGVLSDAIAFMKSHPKVGLFGVYETDYNRPRNYDVHRRLINREMACNRALIGRSPSWKHYLKMAEGNGYRRGDNVFGGAYFMTRECISTAMKLGALNVPWHWNSIMQEDVYFSMVTAASGFEFGHFAAPDGPLCLEWRGLPFPAATLATSKFKVVHSVDKGKNTSPAENGGRSAREIFRALRPPYCETA